MSAESIKSSIEVIQTLLTIAYLLKELRKK